MRKITASLILTCAAFLMTAAQENDLKIPAEVAPFVEPDTKAVAVETADLNGDGTKDYALVLEHLKDVSEDEKGRRSLLILTGGAGGKLTLAKRNDRGAVYCRECGGIFGDPFEALEVGAKTFTVHHYGGSNWRWKNSYQFNYSRIDRTWQLVRVEELSYHTSDPDKMESKIYTPPKHFGKIDIADFDPENYLKKSSRSKK